MLTKKVVYTVSYRDLEELFARTFRELSDYCFVSDQEADNDSLHSFTINGNGGEESLAAINDGSSYNIAQDALNVMCYKSFIAPGEYLVSVSW